jgi:small conductance mechanosensitive channel
MQELADAYLVPLAVRILAAAAIVVLGHLVARQLAIALERVMESARADISLRKFLRDVAYATMLVAVVIAALDALGVETTAMIAVLGAAGLAIGLALQGSLSNVAAGVMLIVLRPYKVGDVVTIGKYQGRVEAIRVFHTVLVTADNREIAIPNAQAISQPIENQTVLGRRRIELVVRVSDVSDLAPVKQLIEEVLLADPRLHPAPEPAIEVTEVTERSATFCVRPWTSTEVHRVFAAELIERLREVLAAAELRFAISLGT